MGHYNERAKSRSVSLIFPTYSHSSALEKHGIQISNGSRSNTPFKLVSIKGPEAHIRPDQYTLTRLDRSAYSHWISFSLSFLLQEIHITLLDASLASLCSCWSCDSWDTWHGEQYWTTLRWSAIKDRLLRWLTEEKKKFERELIK